MGILFKKKEHDDKKRKRVAGIIETVVAVIFIAIAVLVFVDKFTDIHVIKYAPVWVKTGSMEPTIPAQSYILVKYTDASEIKEGDIITFRSPDPRLQGALNTHRVVSVEGDNQSFITKGDANELEDEYSVPATSVEAVYVKGLTVLTAFGRVYSTPFGLIITSALLLFVCFVWVSLYYKREVEKKRQADFERKVAEEVAKLEEMNRNSKDNI